MISDTNMKRILFIDANVSDTDVVMSSLNDSTLGILYNADTTRDEVITNIRNSCTIIDRIGFFCHENAMTFLENESFFESSGTDNILVEKNDNSQFIIDLIQTFNVRNVDFLACNTLKYETWNLFYDLLQVETNVIVGASDNATGNIKYGGDWVLESTWDDVKIVYFTEKIDGWCYTLPASYPYDLYDNIKYQ